MSWINRLEISMGSPTTTGETAMFLLFSFAGGGLMSSVTFTFPLNPPLTKGDLWQDLVLHCFAIVIVKLPRSRG